MARKISEAQRAAFLHAVAQTGNQVAAAERAGVSLGWVKLTRRNEPGFDARVRACLDLARHERGLSGYAAARRSVPPAWAKRKHAVLRALGETGSVSLAAEKAKVSSDWVRRHRKADKAFDAACREAIARAGESLASAPDQVRDLSTISTGSGQASLGAGGSSKPPVGWGHLDGVQLVVRGAPGRRAQVARARARGWCPRTEDRFLQVLSATCNVKAACAAVGLSAAGAYAHRNRWPAFERRWDAAVKEGAMRLEFGLVEAACNIFSAPELPPVADGADMAVTGMTAGDAIRLLAQYKSPKRLAGRHKRLPRLPGIDEVREEIRRRAAAIRAARAISPEEKAREREEWARRRGPGRGSFDVD